MIGSKFADRPRSAAPFAAIGGIGVGGHEEKGALAGRFDAGSPSDTQIVKAATPARRGNGFE